MTDHPVVKLTEAEREAFRARPTRFFLDDSSGTLYRFGYNPIDFPARFDPDLGVWVPDDAAYEFMSRGGYMTEISDAEARTCQTRDDGRALLERTQPRPPFLRLPSGEERS